MDIDSLRLILQTSLLIQQQFSSLFLTMLVLVPTTNPGIIAKTFQSGYATIINKRDYPDIRAIRKKATFADNEELFVDSGTRIQIC